MQRIIDFLREYILPITTIASFFPVYWWSFGFMMPAEVRRTLSPAFYTSLSFELTIAIVAFGFLARLTAYQTVPIIRTLVNVQRRTRKYKLATGSHDFLTKFLAKFDTKLASEVVLPVVYFGLFVLLYFVGLWGIFYFLVSVLILGSAFAMNERSKQVDEGDEDAIFKSQWRILAEYFSGSHDASAFVKRHLVFISLAVLWIPFILGPAYFMGLTRANDVVPSSKLRPFQTKLIAPTDNGLLLLMSEDATLWKLTFRKSNFVIVPENGEIICFGPEKAPCQ
ncbi:hypothetical protein [Ruegeria sp. HKCCD7221]|uniref:hypothetical protein n=1 Tax=Ruegeria sp. HKCCD7221 TaxID=2683009 RepID=UPI001488FA53|nr:hypothetical protein [Ruegeria sp. HKCCD7221]